MTTENIPPRPHGRRAAAAGVVATLLLTLVAALGSSPTAAADAPPAVGLTWKISEHAFTNTGLAQAHATTAPATKEADGFTFPETTSVDYDRPSHAATVAFPGSVELGNTNRGNYRIRLADPIVTLDGEGSGTLSALVSYALPPEPEQDHSYSEPVRVVVANFAVPEEAITDTGTLVSFSVTPDFELVPETTEDHRQFPQTFLDALDESLQGHFRQTGSSADENKAPALLTVGFAVTPPDDGEAFVDRAYEVVLGRSADATGLSYWAERIEGGLSRTAFVTHLAASHEARQRVVALAYPLVLGRPADAGGRAYWADRLARGLTVERLVADLLTSDEAIDHRVSNDPDVWTELLFEVYLGRPSDGAGFSYWAPLVADVAGVGPLHALALRFGRTGEATAHGARTAIGHACPGSPGSSDERSTVTAAWTASHHNPLHTAGIALVTICPDGGVPR